MSLVELLRTLDRAEILIAVRGDRLAVSPRDRITPEIREQILRHRRGLLDLFRDPPTWPPARGRSGLLRDSGRVFMAVGQTVQLRQGGDAVLRALVYDTRTGMILCRVQREDGSLASLDPEEIATLGQASAKAS